MILERFKHFRQSVIKSIKRQSLNIFDNDDDDIQGDNVYNDNIYNNNIYNNDIYNNDIYNDNIYDNKNKNAKCVKDLIEIFEKFQ